MCCREEGSVAACVPKRPAGAPAALPTVHTSFFASFWERGLDGAPGVNGWARSAHRGRHPPSFVPPPPALEWRGLQSTPRIAGCRVCFSSPGLRPALSAATVHVSGGVCGWAVWWLCPSSAGWAGGGVGAMCPRFPLPPNLRSAPGLWAGDLRWFLRVSAVVLFIRPGPPASRMFCEWALCGLGQEGAVCVRVCACVCGVCGKADFCFTRLLRLCAPPPGSPLHPLPCCPCLVPVAVEALIHHSLLRLCCSPFLLRCRPCSQALRPVLHPDRLRAGHHRRVPQRLDCCADARSKCGFPRTPCRCSPSAVCMGFGPLVVVCM
jgi:hypothetical protein